MSWLYNLGFDDDIYIKLKTSGGRLGGFGGRIRGIRWGRLLTGQVGGYLSGNRVRIKHKRERDDENDKVLSKE